MRFRPRRVIFEPKSLDYPLGRKLYDYFKSQDGVEIGFTTSHNQVRNLPGDTRRQAYAEAKRTMVIGVRRTLEFQTSKPSAEYALPLFTGCPGHCHYCYLQTSLGNKPYVRVYVNIEDIFQRAEYYIQKRAPELTRFEGSCVSDPIAVEPYTGSIAAAIQFFAGQPLGRFRFVTKYDEIDGLLNLDHKNRTEVRFSINTPYVVRTFEPGTAPADARLQAARQIAHAGYPLGFLIAPIILYDGWQRDYSELVEKIREQLPENINPFFELITHRFTPRAKQLIQERYPASPLDMNEESRQFKWGQFGYGKYVYRKEDMRRIEEILRGALEKWFPRAEIKYLV